jgi:hypothetical protein
MMPVTVTEFPYVFTADCLSLCYSKVPLATCLSYISKFGILAVCSVVYLSGGFCNKHNLVSAACREGRLGSRSRGYHPIASRPIAVGPLCTAI